MVNLGGIVGGIAGGAGIAIVISAVDKFSSVFNKAKGQISGFGGFLQKNKAAIMGIGTAITGTMTAVAGVSIKAFANFDKALTESLNMFDKVSKEERKLAEDLAKTIAVDLGMAPEEAAKSFWYFGSAGIDLKETMGALPGVLKFAKVNTLGVAEASDFAMTAMKVWGKESKDLPGILDAATFAMKNAKVSMAEMQQSFSYVAPVAAELGIGIEDTAVMTGMLADAGITGSMAGTVLRRSFINLTAPTGKAKDLIQSLGIEVFDSEGKFKGLMPVLKSVADATKGMTQEQRMQAMQTIFGARAIAGMSNVLGNLDKMEGKVVATTGEANGTMDEMFSNIEERGYFQLEQFASQVKVLTAELGEALLPVLQDILAIIKPILEWFRDLGPVWQRAIVIVGMLTGVGLILIPVLYGLSSGFLAITIAGAPLWAIILAIIGAVTAAYLIWKNWDWIIEKVGQAFKWVWTQIKELNPILKHAGKIWEGFIIILTKVWSIIKKVANVIWDIIKAVTEFISQGIGKAIGGVVSAVSTIGGAIADVLGLQEGGIVMRPTLAVIGEAGPEAVVPLHKTGGFGGTTVIVNMNAPFYGDVDELAEALQENLEKRILA